eukprot:scaffold40594_cov53-Cyclotella_meneghiniana.AAC.3
MAEAKGSTTTETGFNEFLNYLKSNNTNNDAPEEDADSPTENPPPGPQDLENAVAFASPVMTVTAESIGAQVVPVKLSNGFMGWLMSHKVKDRLNGVLPYLNPIFLLLALYGVFSAILIVANHQEPKEVCKYTYSRGIVDDARLCYPDVSVMACPGSQVLSLSGECTDGQQGEVMCGGRHGTELYFDHEGMPGNHMFNGCWSADTLSETNFHYIVKSDPFRSDPDCNPPDFGSDCTCCDDKVCETGGRFFSPVDLPIVWSDDVKYPHFGPGCTSEIIDSSWYTPGTSSQALRTECHAYCSDGNWVDSNEEARTRRMFVNLTFIFAWISIGTEALCFVVALFHGVCPLSDEVLPFKHFPCKPVTASLISYYTLIVLGSKREKTYACRDRTYMFLFGTESIAAATLSGIVVFKFNSFTEMMYQWEYLNFFISRLIGVVSFVKDIHKANMERLERANAVSNKATEAFQKQQHSNVSDPNNLRQSLQIAVADVQSEDASIRRGGVEVPEFLPDSDIVTKIPNQDLAPGEQPAYMVKIPEGIMGGKFPVTISGQKLTITCPDMARPGMSVRVIPPPPPQNGATRSNQNKPLWAFLFFAMLLAVCAAAVGLALWQDEPPDKPPEDVCSKITEKPLEPKDKEFFFKFDTDLSGGLSFTEYSDFIDCLYEDGSFLPSKEWCDSNGDEEIIFDEYEACVDMTALEPEKDCENENFNSFDIDKSGGLTPDEFKKYYNQKIFQELWKYEIPDNYLDIYFGGDKNAELTCIEYTTHPYTWLDLVDVDRDGVLSKREFILALRRLIKHPWSDDMFDQYFAEGDENADGKISFEEWRTLLAFITYDEDGDGKFSRDELGRMFCNPGLGLVWDNDGDGYLSYKEYLKMDRNTKDEQEYDAGVDEYNSFDYDQDGFLSRKELFDNMKCWAYSVDPTAAMMDLYMAVGDPNGDARISLAEWSFLKLFYLTDWSPKDGYLSKEEFENFLTLVNISWDFDSFDDDKDGMISLEEWMINAAEMWGVDYNDYS